MERAQVKQRLWMFLYELLPGALNDLRKLVPWQLQPIW
jgi:hypothetical protein